MHADTGAVPRIARSGGPEHPLADLGRIQPPGTLRVDSAARRRSPPRARRAASSPHMLRRFEIFGAGGSRVYQIVHGSSESSGLSRDRWQLVE